MKLFFLALTCLLASMSAKSQVFSQNFDQSNQLSDYVAAQPNAGQLNVATAIGQSEVSVVKGKLRLSKNAAGDARPYIVRSSSLSAGSQFLSVSFKMAVKAQGDATAYLGLGDGYVNDPLPDSLQKSYVRFLFHLLPNGFSIRNSNQGQEGTGKYTGEQQLTLILNNSGAVKNYTAPDGSAQTLDNDRWDLWVNNTKEFEKGTCTNSGQLINNFKFSVLSSLAEVLLDDILIKDLSAQ